MELLDPGVVSCSLWRPDPIQLGTPVEVYLFGGVGSDSVTPPFGIRYAFMIFG
jgi:hypothetical protein